MAPQLSEPQLADALSAARDITDENDRAQALAGLAPHLSERSWPTHSAPPAHHRRVRPGRCVGRVGPAAQRHRCWPTHSAPPAPSPTSTAGPWRWPGWLRSSATTLLAEALSAAYDITDGHARAQALAGLAPQLSEPERTKALADALSAALDITDEYNRAQALAGLAPHLSEPQLADALNAARDITDEDDRARSVGRVGPAPRRA